MGAVVSSGSTLLCSFGAAPGSLTVAPMAFTNTESQPAATVMDHQPMVNIATFGMCSAPTNPQVIAAQGSPVPCVPMTSTPWTPGSTMVRIGAEAALTDASTCLCQWLGQISVSVPGQFSVNAT